MNEEYQIQIQQAKLEIMRHKQEILKQQQEIRRLKDLQDKDLSVEIEKSVQRYIEQQRQAKQSMF
jgi:hypothetical protein